MSQGKTVRESIAITSIETNPADANAYGNVHGGFIMKWVDACGGVTARKHSGAQVVVTASLDRMDFLSPVNIGEVVTCYAKVHGVGRTSMEIGVDVEAENPAANQKWHVATAIMTYVAVGRDNRPMPVPRLIVENDEERQMQQEAEQRLAEARERRKLLREQAMNPKTTGR